MSISEADIKLLWGRAAGMCSRPGCQENLTRLVADRNSYNVGEMAHVIAQSSRGPRGISAGGADSYDNLILLCPTCHREVDKAPAGLFAEDQIHAWKSDHEDRIRKIGLEQRFSTPDGLAAALFATFGDFSDVLAIMRTPMTPLPWPVFIPSVILDR
jgi:hypothetical protein